MKNLPLNMMQELMNSDKLDESCAEDAFKVSSRFANSIKKTTSSEEETIVVSDSTYLG